MTKSNFAVNFSPQFVVASFGYQKITSAGYAIAART